MRSSHSCIAIAIVAVLAPICNADEYYNEANGYKIDLPEDWEEIPEAMVQMAVDLIQKSNATVTIQYDAAFQQNSANGWFEYPYVIVQPIHYPSHRQLNEDDFSDFVNNMLTGTELVKQVDENFTSIGRELLSNIEAGKPLLDMANRRFLWSINMDVQGIGPVRGLGVGYFGRESLVQVLFYTLRDDWDSYADLCATITDSFRFDPDKAYSVQFATANPTSPSLLTRVLENGVTGFVAGAFASLIIVVVGVSIHKKARVAKSMR